MSKADVVPFELGPLAALPVEPWRPTHYAVPVEVAERALAQIERDLAAQGDAAEPELVQLQHDLAALLRGHHQNGTTSPEST